jgi:hypothetical protein
MDGLWICTVFTSYRLTVHDVQKSILRETLNAGESTVAGASKPRREPTLSAILRQRARLRQAPIADRGGSHQDSHRWLKQPQSIPSFFNLYRNALNVIPSFFAVAVLL